MVTAGMTSLFRLKIHLFYPTRAPDSLHVSVPGIYDHSDIVLRAGWQTRKHVFVMFIGTGPRFRRGEWSFAMKKNYGPNTRQSAALIGNRSV